MRTHHCTHGETGGRAHTKHTKTSCKGQHDHKFKHKAASTCSLCKGMKGLRQRCITLQLVPMLEQPLYKLLGRVLPRATVIPVIQYTVIMFFLEPQSSPTYLAYFGKLTLLQSLVSEHFQPVYRVVAFWRHCHSVILTSPLFFCITEAAGASQHYSSRTNHSDLIHGRALIR